MKTQTICPACNGTVSFWAGFKAPTPFTIQCPQCKAKLKTVFPGLPFIFAVVILFFLNVSGGSLILLFARRLTVLQFFEIIGGLLLLWLVLEIIFGIILFTYASFTPRKAKTAKPRAGTSETEGGGQGTEDRKRRTEGGRRISIV